MKAILISILSVIVWVFIGHFFPVFTLSLTAVFFPLVFILVMKFFIESINIYVHTLLAFILLLLQDYLFRIYGGGLHDDAGRGLCEIVFYITSITLTVALVVLKIRNSKNKLKAGDKLRVGQVAMDVFFVLVVSIIALFFFRQFNIFI
jgi:hypothetical protein